MAYRVFDQREFTYQPMLEINATVKACISACDYVKCLAFHISPPAGVPHRICKLYNRVNLQSTTRALAHWNTYVLPLHCKFIFFSLFLFLKLNFFFVIFK